MSWLAIFPQGWAHYLAGGVLIGLGVALLFTLTGRIGGMSTVFSAVWSWGSPRAFFQQPRLLDSRVWRVVFALGLVAGAGLWQWRYGPVGGMRTALPPSQLLLGGLLVGYGARLSGGCTSGHGICGLASLRLPSLLAVMIFMTSAFATAQLVLWVGAAR